MSAKLLATVSRNVIEELGEENAQDDSLEDSKDLARYEEELGRNSLTLSNTNHYLGSNLRPGDDGNYQDDDL